MLRVISFSWVVGVAFMGHSFDVWPIWSTFIVLLALIILGGQVWIQRHLHVLVLRCFNAGMAAFISLNLGFSYASVQLQQRLEFREMQSQTASILVYVKQLNHLNENSVQQKVQVFNRHSQPVTWLTFHAFEDTNTKFFTQKIPRLELGKYYRLTGEIRPAHSYAIAGVFDQEKWYLQQNLMAGFRIQQFEVLDVDDVHALGFSHYIDQQQKVWHRFILNIERQRLMVREYLQQQNFQNAGLLLALLTGDESLLDAQLTQDFRRYGMSHLLAISGPHVLIFAALFCIVLEKLIACYIPYIYLKIPKKRLFILPFLACVVVYSACTGFEIPALRTVLICVMGSLFILFKLPFKPFTLLLYSAGLLLLIDPFSVLSAAFWLSYGACLVLLRIYQTIYQQPISDLELTVIQKFKQGFLLLLESQWKIFIALLPLMLIFFKQIAWISPLTNLIAIPWLGCVVVPLDILAGFAWLFFEPLGVLLWYISDWALSFLLHVLMVLDSLLKPQLVPWALNFYQMLALLCGLILLFLPKGLIPKTWSILCVFPLFYYDQKRNDFELYVLDVGQGQAIFVRYQEYSLMVDVGGSIDENRFSVGEQLIFPFLNTQGVQYLDQVILTHLDQDHSGAYARLAEKIEIHRVSSNEQIKFQHPNFHYCYAGQKWHWKNHVYFEVLSPQRGVTALAPEQRNENSCVVHIKVADTQGYQHFLLMGDAGWLTEAFILHHYPHLKVDVLLLGHHGSKHSSAYGFLQHYQPKMSIASAGFMNRYDHPSQALLARLKDLNLPLLTTPQQGSLIFYRNAEGDMQLKLQRQQKIWLERVPVQ